MPFSTIDSADACLSNRLRGLAQAACELVYLFDLLNLLKRLVGTVHYQ